MNRITEAEYISALKLISAYREQIVTETQDVVGGVNPLAQKNDIIRIIKARGTGNHREGDEFVVEKSTKNGERVVIKTINGRIVRSINYDWVVCGVMPDIEKASATHVNKEIDFPDVELNDMDLSVRAYNGLRAMKLDTLYKIIEAGKKEIGMHRNIGAGTVHEIVTYVFTKYNYLIR